MDDEGEFRDALNGLRAGDFSRLEPLFLAEAGMAEPRIVRWHRAGRFRDEPEALGEALTCACFLGRTEVAEYLLAEGVDPTVGDATGVNAVHWAANRGQLDTVRLLLRRNVPLETRNRFGGTTLAMAVWSAIHEPRPQHLGILEELLAAGADITGIEYPTGNEQVDAVLRRHGAGARGDRGGA